MELKEILNHLKDGINDNIKKAIKLEGEKLKRFCEIFNQPEDISIYYTDYNIIFTNQETYESLEYLVKKSSIVMEVKIKTHNVFVIVYEYISDAMFENYLNDPEIEEY